MKRSVLNEQVATIRVQCYEQGLDQEEIDECVAEHIIYATVTDEDCDAIGDLIFP